MHSHFASLHWWLQFLVSSPASYCWSPLRCVWYDILSKKKQKWHSKRKEYIAQGTSNSNTSSSFRVGGALEFQNFESNRMTSYDLLHAPLTTRLQPQLDAAHANVKVQSHCSHDSRRNTIIRLFFSPQIISIVAILG